MKIFNMPRQSGKTTQAIRESNRTGKVIVTSNYESVNQIKRMAERLQLEIPEPICYLDMYKSKLGICQCDRPIGYIIDDFHRVLRQLTGGVPVETIYISDEEPN